LSYSPTPQSLAKSTAKLKRSCALPKMIDTM